MQTLRDALWIFQNELRIGRRDSAIVAVLFVMPFVVLYLVAPAMRPALIMQGYPDATGAEQAMPGIAVLFSNFAMAFLAFAIFREHTWMTWDRLLAAPMSRVAIFGGKALLPFLLVITQQLILMSVAGWIFGVELRAGLVAYILLSAALAFFTVGAGLALSAWLSSLQEVNSVVNVGTFALAGLGGAFGPLEYMPEWIQAVSVFSPNFWAIDGFKTILLDPVGANMLPAVRAILPGAGVLVVCGALLFCLALPGFLRDREKRAWA